MNKRIASVLKKMKAVIVYMRTLPTWFYRKIQSWVLAKCYQRCKLALLFSLTLAVIMMITLGVMTLTSDDHSGQPDPISNLRKINHVQSQLNTIEHTVTSSASMTKHQVNSLKRQLQAIEVKLTRFTHNNHYPKGASKQAIQQLKSQLHANKVTLSQRIVALNQSIKRIKKKVAPPPTLSPQALPFKVVSVDPWNGQPYAQIVRRHNSAMRSYVGLYQTQAGWKVIDLNASEQTVTWVNQKGQVVHVHTK